MMTARPAARWMWIAALLCGLLHGYGTARGQDAVAEPPDHPTEPYLRVQREAEPGGERVTLQVASRRLQSTANPPGPVIDLVGVVHLGDEAYFTTLQQYLAQHDVVLYEAVGRPPFVQPAADLDDEQRARLTRKAMAFIHDVIDERTVGNVPVPPSAETLLDAVRSDNRLEAAWLRAALTDAWGRPIEYDITDGVVKLRSLGADGEPGGEGAAADILDERPVPPARAAAAPNLQQRFARALGLTFQLHAIDYEQANFRHADLPLERLRVLTTRSLEPRVAEGDAGPDGDGDADADGGGAGKEGGTRELKEMMEMLDGRSVSGKIASMAMRFIGASPKLRAVTKMVLIEMLGQIEGDLSRMAGMPAGMRQMMEILIQDRNDIVLREIRRLIESPDDQRPRTIAVFFGAGHMADLEHRLVTELGYEPAGDQWFDAFEVDTAGTGMSQADVAMLRAMISAQMKAMQRAP